MHTSQCKECGGRCVYTRSDLTCTQCGLEQFELVFESEFNVQDRVAIFLPQDKGAVSRCYAENKKEIFSVIESTLCPTDDQVQLMKEVYDKFLEKMQIKGFQRRLELGCACYYHVLNGKQSQQNICDKMIGYSISSFQWACKELANLLGGPQPMNKLYEPNSKIIRIVSEELAKHSVQSSQEWYQKIRPIVTRLLTKIEHDPRITCTHPEKVNVTLAMMACKILKAPTTLKRVAMLLLCSEPTILKIEKIVKDILSE